MLRELLLSLQGYPGSFFVISNNKIEVSPFISWLSPSELTLLTDILEVGSGYCALMKYSRLTRPEGLYITTVRKCIQNALEGYLNCLASLETDALENSGLSLSKILGSVRSYGFLISGLYDLVRELETHEAHGCYVLDIVHRHTLSGIPAVQRAMEKLMNQCKEVFTKQMISWLVFGRLRDPYKEFFVAATSEDAQAFRVEGKLIPTCLITPSLAAQALSIGEMVNVFLRSKLAASDEKEELDVVEQIQSSQSSWETALEVARRRVAKRMWRLVVTDGMAKVAMTAIHDFFLMGRGEIFIELLDKASSYLDVVPNAGTQSQFQHLLIQSATRALGDHDEELENVKVNIRPASGPGDKQSGWQRLKLQYKTSWTVSLLLGEEVLEQYSDIFVRLLYLKHVQTQLHKLWSLPRQEAREQSMEERSEITVRIYEMRWNMLQFLLHFCHYVQADVIQPLWFPLQQLLQQKEGDFEELRNAQAYFLVTAKAQMFLTSGPVRACLDDLLSLCLQFSQIVCNYSPDQLSDFVASLRIVDEEFHRLFSLFVTLLTSLRKHSQLSEPDSGLAQLLFRFDLTGFKTSSNKSSR